jgi:hypothetical protein
MARDRVHSRYADIPQQFRQHLVEPCGGKVGAGSKTENRFGWVKNTLCFLQITQPQQRFHRAAIVPFERKNVNIFSLFFTRFWLFYP